MLEPGQKGYKANFSITFKADVWYLETLWHDRVYVPGECVKGVQINFGWANDNVEEAKQWLIQREEKDGMALDKVELVSIQPWRM